MTAAVPRVRWTREDDLWLPSPRSLHAAVRTSENDAKTQHVPNRKTLALGHQGQLHVPRLETIHRAQTVHV